MFHLAQVNIARLRAPITDPILQGFVSRIQEIHELADGSEGFVWRFKDEEHGTGYVQVFGDDRLLFNMSVWESVGALKQFTYRSSHRELLGSRELWFERMPGPYAAMWWLPAGTLPSIEDAKARLDSLAVNSDTAYSFSFRKVFAPPISEAGALAQQA